MSLHPEVLFIGDRPNPKKNLSMDVPFVGTKSYKTLLEWCYRMDVNLNRVSMMNAYDINGVMSPNLHFIVQHSGKVITLGAGARGALAGVKYQVDQFHLPHPSGINRELNDKKKLSEQLTRCRAWLYKEQR